MIIFLKAALAGIAVPLVAIGLVFILSKIFNGARLAFYAAIILIYVVVLLIFEIIANWRKKK